MTLPKKINLVLLIVLSLSTGVVKIMGFEADVQIFERIGFSYLTTVLFGVVQAIGGLLLIVDRTRKMASLIMAATFLVASVGVFVSGMIPFGIFSLLFIGMCGVAYNSPSKVKSNAV